MAEPGSPRRPSRLELAVLAAVAAGLLYSAWGLWHDRRLASAFEKVPLGMDRAAAEAVLGRPDREGGCGDWVASLPRADCALELGYASAFAPITGLHYLVQLDRNGRVIEADAVRSRSWLPRA